MDDLHTIHQRIGNIQRIRRCHEHHFGQVIFDLDIMVDECAVLFRIQHLKQCRGRITAHIHTHLVHFIQQEQRVFHRDLAHVLQNLARHGTDIRTTMAADFGLVAHAAQRHAHEFAVGGTRDRLAQRSLAHPRRTDQTQDGCLHPVHALLHSQVFKNAFLDLFQTIVVFFEHHFGHFQIAADLGFLLPGQPHQYINVVPHHSGFGRHRRHQTQFFQFRLGLVARFLGHVRGLDLLLYLVKIGSFFAVTQFLLDRLDLLVQVILALALLHLAPYAPADALFDLEYVDFTLQQSQQMFQTFAHTEDFQNFLFLFQLEGQMGRDRIG